MRHWVKQADLDANRRSDGLTTEEREELRRLRRENRILREEREIPKKRPPCARTQADQALLDRIRVIHEQSRQTYGAPRIHAELRDMGVHCGRKRVARLMRQAGVAGAHRRHRPRTTVRDQQAVPAPDLVARAFRADHPDRFWLADITYVRTWSGWLYVAVVLDAFSRCVVGWAMTEDLRTELVLDALNMALWNFRPSAGVMHHSDRGCQYTSLAFGRLCREAGIVPSMGRRGDAYDNAMAEAFFATLETELLIAAGRDPKYIAQQAGHHSAGFTLDRYGHLV